jgi:putative phosphoesterase
MSTRLLIMADTHIPRRAKQLPAELEAAIPLADIVLHAGDWVDVTFLDHLESVAARLVGVYGNNDHGVLRDRLPQEAHVAIEGLRFGVVHETGPAAGRENRCANAYPDLDVLVFGHSHIPWDTTAANGLRLLNPGSPTDRRRQPHATYLTATAVRGELLNVTFHALPGRSSTRARASGPAEP